MKKNEAISLVQYLLFHQAKLNEAVRDCHVRFYRRDLDSIDLLEEIIALERLNECLIMSDDIIRILKLCDENIYINSICLKCLNSSKCKAQECDKFRDNLTNLVVDCRLYRYNGL